MSVTVDEFVKSLADTGILSADELQSVQDTLPNYSGNVQALAKDLVRRDKLTEFQARILHDGKRGVTVGSYLLLDEIGAGGMGRVYKARHRRMKRVVALKVLSPAARLLPDAIRRFQREVEAAAKLNHANIVTAYDADEEAGMHYLVMEYVEGASLAEVVERNKPLPVGAALDYAWQVASGLRYAHQQGIVHRDIKPNNLLLNASGVVKILDMGLARFEQSPGALDEAGDEKLTRAGQILGTLDFMSPEQAEDTRLADARSDIYSLGCTLYFLLTGDVPYHGDTVMRKLLAHREHPVPSLLQRRSDVPKHLDSVFRRMAAKLPQDRFQTMDEVMGHLEAGRSPVPAGRSGLGLLKHGLGSGILSSSSLPPPVADPLSDSNVLSPSPADGDDEIMLQEDADKIRAQTPAPRSAPRGGQTIDTSCACGRRLVLKAELLGRKVKCPACGAAVTVAQQDSPRSAAERTIETACRCGARFAAQARLAGKTVKCGKCGETLSVPTLAARAPQAVPDKIEVACACGKRLRASADLAGKSVKCPSCSGAVKIPRTP